MARLDLQGIRDAVSSIDPAFLNTPQFDATPLDVALCGSMILKVETANPLGHAEFGRRLDDQSTVLDEPIHGSTVATIVCGSNVTPTDFQRWVVLDPMPRRGGP